MNKKDLNSWDEFYNLFAGTDAPVDLLTLLTKYISYIKDVEGVDFIENDKRIYSDVKFSNNEWSLLESISSKKDQ